MFVPIKNWKAVLIELLNIAGTGPISGFHATQAPMISKCITSEGAGHKVFYGAMIIEAVIALIWAAAGVAFYGRVSIRAEKKPEKKRIRID